MDKCNVLKKTEAVLIKPTSANALALKDSASHMPLVSTDDWLWLFLKAALTHFIFIFLNGAQLEKKNSPGLCKTED